MENLKEHNCKLTTNVLVQLNGQTVVPVIKPL